MQYAVNSLDGALLDAAVAKAEGIQHDTSGLPRAVFVHQGADSMIYNPSANWALAGPIIERERITLAPCKQGWHWVAYAGAYWVSDAVQDFKVEADGETALVAAMRAYISSKVGETIELP